MKKPANTGFLERAEIEEGISLSIIIAPKEEKYQIKGSLINFRLILQLFLLQKNPTYGKILKNVHLALLISIF